MQAHVNLGNIVIAKLYKSSDLLNNNYFKIRFVMNLYKNYRFDDEMSVSVNRRHIMSCLRCIKASIINIHKLIQLLYKKC